jgi:AcrR family transcriptional regulator
MTPHPPPPTSGAPSEPAPDGRPEADSAATRVAGDESHIQPDDPLVATRRIGPARRGGDAPRAEARPAVRRRPSGGARSSARPRPPVEVTPTARPAERPTLSRDAIVSAALVIADSEGVDAVSMRRVAARLGVGTMTIYGHVRDKDELLTLMWDRVTAEQLLPEVPADWREALAALARSARLCVLRHPWMIGLKPRIAENVLLHIEQALEATKPLGDDGHHRLVVINILDDLVAGCAIREIASGHAGQDHDPANCGLRAKFRSSPELLGRVRSGEFPNIAHVIDQGGCIHADRFERGLSWLLDGIERDHGRSARQ